MHAVVAMFVLIRNFVGSFFTRATGFWVVNVLIALVVPSPIAAPVLYARFRRARRLGRAEAPAQHAPV